MNKVDEINDNGKRQNDCALIFSSSNLAKLLHGQKLIAEGQKLVAECYQTAVASNYGQIEPVVIPEFIEEAKVESKKKRTKKSPANPDRKKLMTGYLLFCKEKRESGTIDSTGGPHSVVTLIGHEWQQLKDEEKLKYNERAKALNAEVEKSKDQEPPVSPPSSPKLKQPETSSIATPVSVSFNAHPENEKEKQKERGKEEESVKSKDKKEKKSKDKSEKKEKHSEKDQEKKKKKKNKEKKSGD